MARNSTNDRNDTTGRNLDHAAQNRELTDAELDGVSAGAFEIKDWSFGVTTSSTIS